MSRLRAGLPLLRARLPGRTATSPPPDVFTLTPEDVRYLTTLADDSVPLPPGADAALRPDNPRLLELQAEYAALDLPVLSPSRWSHEAIDAFLDLRYFRGETLITWHYRELPRISQLKYFVLARYVIDRDPLGYLARVDEDGAFGCWTFSYPGLGRVSRDLLESVNEICFLDRQLGLADRNRFSVLDIGAGYGRLAHRMAGTHPNLDDYCCVDAVPHSTFLSEYYLRHRGVVPPARVVSLGRVADELEPGTLDLAVNVHSFSECPLAAIAWWADLLDRLQVPSLLIVPNEPDQLLSLEADGTRRDFQPLLEHAGYRLACREPVLADPAVSELLELDDHFHLFTRER